MALKETVSTPNTLLANEKSYATIVLGFPELEFSPNEVYSSERFGMSLAAEYSRTLDAEAERCIGWTFRDICQRPMPMLFERIYDRDKSNWFNSQSRKQRSNYESDIVT